MPHSELYIGLMSGTSMDGIDVALVDFSNECRLIGKSCVPYPAKLRADLIQLAQRSQQCQLDELGHLDQLLGQSFAQAAMKIIEQQQVEPNQIAAIGSHGQTIYHRPGNQNSAHIPYSLQIGDPNIIAETTGITTVADFRRRDIAAGGQGAPLVPAFHASVFSKEKSTRAVVNIGGIANITILEGANVISGFDIGPGNCLMDQWCRKHYGKPYDADGKIAATGVVSTELLARVLDDPYFKQSYPKSTGPEYFNLDWLEQHIRETELDKHDVLRTLNQFTAVVIAQTIKQEAKGCTEIYICGGGAHNKLLRKELATLLMGLEVKDSSVLGIDPDYVEAAAFAWLARQTLLGKTGNIPTVTGAKKTVVLGSVCYA